MATAGVSSYRSLSKATGVSLWQLQQLRQGKIQQMRLEPLQKLSTHFQLSIGEFIHLFEGSTAESQPDIHAQRPQRLDSEAIATPSGETQSDRPYAELKAEYDRLKQHVDQQRQQVAADQIQAALHTLESWMLQWPTATKAAQSNPEIPASRLIPLVRPIEALLEQWGVRAIATVGDEIPYDPSQHQLMSGSVSPGDRVRVRYVGYRLNDKLLHRAKVSPVES
jgi:molecular chaperone GrpE (heat shock protein)